MARIRILTAVVAALAFPAAAAAQEAAASAAPRPFCFNGARLAECGTFVIAEMQGTTPLIQSTRAVAWGGDVPRETGFLGERLQWEVGLMHNVSERWAVGGAARLGSGDAGVVNALSVRARRWMSDVVAVDVSAGTSFLVAPYPQGRRTGFTADARLNFRDDAYVGLRYDQAAFPSGSDGWGGFDEGGNQHGLSLLAGVGSEWALGGSAAVGLGLVLLLALVDWE